MQWLLLGLVAVTGAFNSIQSGSNSMLNKVNGSPTWSAVIVFAVGLCTTLVAALVSGQRFPGGTLAQVPWWSWVGGCLGAAYVLAMMIVASKVGAAVFMAVTVTAAIITSLALDHFGAMGFEQHTAGIGRILGGLAITGGLVLIAKY